MLDCPQLLPTWKAWVILVLQVRQYQNTCPTDDSSSLQNIDNLNPTIINSYQLHVDEESAHKCNSELLILFLQWHSIRAKKVDSITKIYLSQFVWILGRQLSAFYVICRIHAFSTRVFNCFFIFSLQCVCQALQLISEVLMMHQSGQRSNLIQLLVALHMAHAQIQARLSHFSRLVEVYPDLVDPKNIRRLANQDGEMVRIFTLFFYQVVSC